MGCFLFIYSTGFVFFSSGSVGGSSLTLLLLFLFLKSLASVQLAFNAGEASQMRVEMSSRT